MKLSTICIIAILQFCFLMAGLFLSSQILSTIDTVYASTAGLEFVLTGSSSYSVAMGTATEIDIIIPSTYNGKAVKSIAANGFEQMYALRSITIPNTVTSIGAYAFRDCYALTSAPLPSFLTSIGNSAFSNSGITSLTIPNTVSSIGSSAFYDCSALGAVSIPSNVTTISSAAFASCDNITTLTFSSGLQTIDSSAFIDCRRISTITLPNTLRTINNSAFSNCIGLTTINFGTGIKTIGNYAFNQCNGLTSITIPNTVTTIGNHIFYDCANLVTVVVGNGLQTIPVGAFQSCIKLTNVTIPDTITLIEDNSFANCEFLASITLPRSVATIRYNAFLNSKLLTNITIDSNNLTYSSIDGVVYSKDATILIKCPEGISALTVPESVTRIENYAFNNCSKFTEITIPEGVLSLGQHSFDGVYGLTSILFPASLTSIEMSAFGNCNGLTSVLIPATVKTIGGNIFANCSNLQSVTIEDGGVSIIPSYVFYNCPKLTSVTLPDDIVELGTYAFGSCILLESILLSDGLATISTYAFNNCRKLATITIPSTVTVIGLYTFLNCSALTEILVDSLNTSFTSIDGVLYNDDATTLIYNPEKHTTVSIESTVRTIDQFSFFYGQLTTITIPDNVTLINQNAFFNCYSLTTAIIGTGVTSLPLNLFNGCSSLVNVTIPSSVLSFGANVFTGCTNLVTIVMPDSVTTVGESTFQGCSKLENVTLSANLTNTNSFMFYQCSKLVSLVIPEKVTAIGYYAFYACTLLSSINLPNTIRYIDSYAFQNCSSLTNIKIPINCTSIGSYAFQNCYALQIIYVRKISPITSLGYDSLRNTNGNLVIYVSALAINAYKTDLMWITYANRIFTLEFIMTFQPNGGSAVASLSKEFDEDVTPPTPPTRAGCVFGGWHSDPELTQEYTISKMPENNITLYAKWLVDVTFDVEGVQTVVELQVGKEYEYIEQQVLSRVGWSFLGWDYNGTIASVATEYVYADGIVLDSTFQINKYSIIIEANGGTATDSELNPITDITEDYDTNVSTRRPDASRTGYTFVDWFEDNETFEEIYQFTTIPATDQTIYAKWVAIKYIVSFDPQGGDPLYDDSKQVVYDDDVGSMPSPSRTGYTFVEWNTAEDGVGQTLTPDDPYQIPEDETLYAIWQPNVYRIYFNSAGGVVVNMKLVTFDTEIGALEVPIKLLNNFVGWQYQSSYLTEDMVYTLSHDITVIAIWEPIVINYKLIISIILGVIVVLYFITMPGREKNKKIRKLLRERKM